MTQLEHVAKSMQDRKYVVCSPLPKSCFGTRVLLTMDNPQKIEASTIGDFLKLNHIQMSSIGVMAGLASFLGTSTNLPRPFPLWPVMITYLFSLLMMIGAVLIWSDMKSRFPKNSDLKLKAFKWTLSIAYWLVILYLLLMYRNLSKLFLFVGIFVVFVRPLMFSILGAESVRKSVRKLKSKKYGEFIFKTLVIIFAVVLTTSLQYVSLFANNVLDFVSGIQMK